MAVQRISKQDPNVKHERTVRIDFCRRLTKLRSYPRNSSLNLIFGKDDKDGFVKRGHVSNFKQRSIILSVLCFRDSLVLVDNSLIETLSMKVN